MQPQDQATQDPVTDEARWAAVVDRDESADGVFFFAVATTGVYCYPSCSAKRPRRGNVSYFPTGALAEAAGYRPCKRCRSDLAPPGVRRARLVAEACRRLRGDVEPTLEELAGAAGMSPHHFHRVFKRSTGLTPKQYARAQRDARLRELLGQADTVTDAIFAAGYGSNSRFYERADEVLGMSARTYSRGGTNEQVRYCVCDCWLGKVLVAATAVGVCAILMGSDEQELHVELRQRFPQALLEEAHDDSQFAAWVSAVIDYLDAPQGDFSLPLDIAGTAFQERVWAELRKIPSGVTASYGEIAEAIGQPSATRAVATACAANPLAVAVPCHRVVRRDGKLSGYRWGVERKRALLKRESEIMGKR